LLASDEAEADKELASLVALTEATLAVDEAEFESEERYEERDEEALLELRLTSCEAEESEATAVLEATEDMEEALDGS
jgi:hypothetical protein